MPYRSDMIDPGPWPFRPAADGETVDQYHRRGCGGWRPCVGVPDSYGYPMVSWTQKDMPRRWKRLHCVVWETYNGPVPKGLEIDHLNMDKGDSRLSNLQLVTHRQNLVNARNQLGNWSRKMAKLTDGQLLLLLALPDYMVSLRVLAERWGMSKFTLGNIRCRAKQSGDPRYLGGL